MSTERFRTRVVTVMIILIIIMSSVQPVFAVGSNDNFADATQITDLPYSTNADNTSATSEGGEPYPSCGYGNEPISVWYSYTPSANTSLTVRASYYDYPPILAIYTGSWGNLTQIACGNYSTQIAFPAQASVTYYFQLSSFYPWYQGTFPFSLEFTPPPQVNFYYYPNDPSIFDNVTFYPSVSDPGGNGIASYAWTSSDGASSDQYNFFHQFASDGDYTIGLTATTFDGRSGSASQVVHVRTKDVAITKFSIPQTTKVNQTKAINVDVYNNRYSDYVQVTLYKGLPGGGEQLIGTLTIYVPARANRPTTFKFSYTFTSDDAAVGKVVFKAVATIVNGRDALPADNTATGTTLVTGASSFANP